MPMLAAFADAFHVAAMRDDTSAAAYARTLRAPAMMPRRYAAD